MKIIFLILAALVTHLGYGQSFTGKITKEYSFEKKSTDNAVLVANINGDITVKGYDGDKVMLEVTRSIIGKTEARLEKGKQEVQLGVIDRADTLIFYVEDGCNSFGKKIKQKGNNGWHPNGWGYNWNCDDGNCKQEYDYKMDFTLKVPSGMNVLVSTINDGDVIIEKVNGAVRADNINGSIRLANLERESYASTINGDVDIEYTSNPKKDCRFYTLNGDINAFFQKGLAADLSFESFNGEFYTNIDKIQAMPVRIEKSTNGDGIKFKVNGNRYQVGNGGVFLDFETFNGNVYLKEK